MKPREANDHTRKHVETMLGHLEQRGINNPPGVGKVLADYLRGHIKDVPNAEMINELRGAMTNLRLAMTATSEELRGILD